MKYELSDFLTIRTKILQNSVLNSLLIAYLSSAKSPIFVGKTLVKLDGKLKKMVKESKEGEKTPSFIMVNVFALINDVPATLGYIYKDFPPVFLGRTIFSNTQKIKDTAKGSIIYYFKLLSTVICNIYPLNASSADKIFSKPPNSFSNFLEANGISTSYWQTGFPKKIKKVALKDVEKSELEEYYEALNKRLLIWRNFNLLLIELAKKGRSKISHSEYGEVKAELFFHSLNDRSIAIEIIPKGKENGEIHMLKCEKLSPKTLNLSDTENLQLLKIFEGS